MTASPKMDDDGLTREQYLARFDDAVRAADLASARSLLQVICALESRSEVLAVAKQDDGMPSWSVLVHGIPVGRWACSGFEYSIEAYAKNFARALNAAASGIKAWGCNRQAQGSGPCTYWCGSRKCPMTPASRAEPGAPERTLEQDSEDAYHFAEPKPAGAQATSPSQEGHAAGPASAAPERARPDAIQPDMSDYDRGLRDGRARGLAEGLEEAAKVCEIYFDDEDEWLTRQTREVANAIRAKIKP